MAKENSFRLYGQIISHPKVYFNSEGEAKRGDFMLKVWRRADGNNRFFDNYSYDCPVIMTRNPKTLKVFAELSLGDMVLIDGVVCSRTMKKISLCDSCKNENERVGLIVWVEPIMIMPLDTGLSEAEGNELLQEYTEVSNKGFIIGRLCKDPEIFTKEEEGKKKPVRITQYLLCVERHYRIKEDEDERKQDYIWVKTYGKQAELDYDCLSKGSYVYISGALQTRNITITKECDVCGQEYKVNESVTEIVPYSVEYLENWNRPAQEKEQEVVFDKENNSFDNDPDEDLKESTEENENSESTEESDSVLYAGNLTFGALHAMQD